MKNIWNRKFPTLIGLILITAGTIITTLLVKNDAIFQIKAGPGDNPKNIKISNISDSSFTVSYTTDDQVIGTVSYGIDSNNLDSITLDDRDQLSQNISRYEAHSITLRNLESDTKYYFNITSGNKKYLNNGSNFEVFTGSGITENPSSQIPISGKVILPNGNIPKDGLVYAKTSESQLISALLKEDGTYTIPLNTLRNTNLSEYVKIDSNTLINIDIYAESLFSSVSVSSAEISPVPLVTLSGSFDFSNASNDPTPGKTDQTGGFPTFGNTKSDSGDPKILTPDTGENLESQPVFEGTAQPNETVELTIHSDENIKTQIKTDAKGNWKYAPTSELSPGEHTITITTKNKNGILKTITQSFIVSADGGRISHTPTPTTAIKISPSPIPTVIITPTIAPTLTFETSPIPTLPPTGNSSVIIATIAGFAATFTGIVIFFLTRGRNIL